MTDKEMQRLQDSIIEDIQDFFDKYDWDSEFIKHLEA